MDSEIIRLLSIALVGMCVSWIYWLFIGVFIKKQWLKILISILMMGITIYLVT